MLLYLRENVTEAEMSKFDKKYESLRIQLPASVRFERTIFFHSDLRSRASL